MACQMFVTEFGDIQVYPLKNKDDYHMALYQYSKEIGVPTSLQMDNTKDMDVRKKWKKVLAREDIIKTSWNEPHTLQQNDAEQEIKIIKIKTIHIMKAANMQSQPWGFVMIHEDELISFTPIDNYPNMEGRITREFIE